MTNDPGLDALVSLAVASGKSRDEILKLAYDYRMKRQRDEERSKSPPPPDDDLPPAA